MSSSSLGTSSYLRYIHKFRNSTSSATSCPIADEYQEPLPEYSNHNSQHNTVTKDSNALKNLCNQESNQSVALNENPNILNKIQRLTGRSITENISSRNDTSLIAEKFLQVESQDQLQIVLGRLDKQKESTQDILKLLKLLQKYNDSQESETHQIRDSIKDLNIRVQSIENKQLNSQRDDISVYPYDFKDKVANEVKQMGREMAMDIVKLSKRMSIIYSDTNKQFKQVEDQLNTFKTKIDSMQLRNRQRIQRSASLQKASKLADEKNQSMYKNLENIQRRLTNLSKEVKRHRGSHKSKEVSRPTFNITTTDKNQASLNCVDQICSAEPSQILERIRQLEQELEQFKSKINTISNPQGLDCSQTPFNDIQHCQMSQSVDVGEINQSPCFSLGPIVTCQKHLASSQNKRGSRQLSENAKRLQESLDKRFSDLDITENERNTRIRQNRKSYKAMMDISFSSSSSEYQESGNYQCRGPLDQQTLPPYSINNTSNIQKLKSKKSRSRSKSKSKSQNRKSLDDLRRAPDVNVPFRQQRQGLAAKDSQRSKADMNTKVNSTFDHLSDYFKQKEEVLRTRAKRLIQLSNKSYQCPTKQQSRQKGSSTSRTRNSNSNKGRLKAFQKRKSMDTKTSCLTKNLKKNMLADRYSVSKTIESTNPSNSLKFKRGQEANLKLLSKTLK